MNNFPPSPPGGTGTAASQWGTVTLPQHLASQPNPSLSNVAHLAASGNFVAQLTTESTVPAAAVRHHPALMVPVYFPAAAFATTSAYASPTTASTTAASPGPSPAMPAMISALSHPPYSAYPTVGTPMMLCTNPWTQTQHQPPPPPPQHPSSFLAQSSGGEPIFVFPSAQPPAHASSGSSRSDVSRSGGDGSALPHSIPLVPPSLAFSFPPPPPPAFVPVTAPVLSANYGLSPQHCQQLLLERQYLQHMQQSSHSYAPPPPPQQQQQQQQHSHPQQQARHPHDVLRAGQSLTGYVKRYNPGHGFGFIKASNGVDIFVHQAQSHCLLTVGLRVKFDVAESADQFQAINVAALDTPPPPLSTPTASPLSTAHSANPTGAAVPSSAMPPVAVRGGCDAEELHAQPDETRAFHRHH